MPTVADVEPLHQLLAGLRAGEPLRHGPLTVIPLTADPAPEPDWLTLGEAGDAVVIEEVSHGGHVPTLVVTNTADRPVLLLDGEELVGAKQNRVLNTTVLVARGARLDIPVSCVEQGRWSYTSRRFAPGDTACTRPHAPARRPGSPCRYGSRGGTKLTRTRSGGTSA